MRKANEAKLKYFSLFIILSFIVAATGCATRMALEKNKTTLDTSKESIALMTIRTSNQVKQKYQLPLSDTWVKTGEGKKAEHFATNRHFNYVKHQFTEYLISLALPPGKNTIWLITGRIRGGSYAGFQIKPNISFNLEPDSIVYLGHLEMVNRLKSEGEKQPARFVALDGSLLGLLLGYTSYGLAGLPEGFMELTITDRFDEDIKNFKQRYPVLENYTIKKDIIKPEKEEDKCTTP